MIYTKDETADVYASIEGMDPRADWLLGPGVQDFLPSGEDTLIPFIMSLHDDAGLAVINGFVRGGSPIFISPVYLENLGIGEYFVAWARKAFFEVLAKEDGDFEDLRAAKKEIQLCAPGRATSLLGWEPGMPLPAALAPPPVKPPAGGWPQGTVVVGVIDDGIAFAHERFRDAAGQSRVQCFWRQGPPDTSASVEFGTEIGKTGPGGIDALLGASTIAGAVDEDRFYRSAGLIDFARPYHKAAAWRIAHGTHVLDLAAGQNPAEDIGDRPIVAVQLPTEVTADTSGAGLEDKLIRAVRYILARAQTMAGTAGPLPVVINFSYGLIAGPHDGTSRIERAFDDLIQKYPGELRIVLPAGNSHLSRCHAEVRFTHAAEVVELPWRVQPDDRTPSRVEVWLPHAGPAQPAASRLRLSVVTPDGLETPLLGETHGIKVAVENDGEEICTLRYRFIPWPTERGTFFIELQPTARLQPAPLPDALRIALPGVWTVKLHNVSLTDQQPVQAWIERDDTPYGYPTRGRQSYFDDPRYLRFDFGGRVIEEDDHPAQAAHPCPVKRARLVNGIATGAETIVAGGYHRKDLRVALYSAGGPITPTRGGTLDPNERKPDATLVSEDSKVHAGVLAAGSRSGSLVAISGTSVAAPQLTRWIAGELAAGNAGDRAAVKAEAIADEALHPASKPPLPAARGGWGRMLRGSAFPRERYWDWD